MKQWRTVVMALVVMSLPVLGFAQQAASPTSPPQERPGRADGKMDQDWQARHEKMVADMKAMDARLDEKVAAMNAAKGDQKVEAMAAVINELVAQRKEMKATLGPMHHGMKCPRMGESAAMPEDCPMMKQQRGAPADVPAKQGSQ